MDMARGKGWLLNDEQDAGNATAGGAGGQPARPAGWLNDGSRMAAIATRQEIEATVIDRTRDRRRGAQDQTIARNAGMVKSTTAMKRKEWGNKIARAAGFEDNEAKFLFGASTLVADSGRKSYLAKRKAHQDMNWCDDVLDQLQTTISGELRQDEKCRIEQLDFNSDGSVWWPGSPMTGRIELDAIPDMTRALGMPSAGEYLAGCTPKVRNYNLDEWKHFNVENGMGEKIVNLRHRDAGSIFAVTGSQYQNIDTDVVARIMRDVVPSDAKGEVTYDGRTARMRAVWMDENLPQDDLAVGDYLMCGIEVKTNDVGKGSVRIRAFIIQVKCINFNVTTGWIDVLNMRHDQRLYAGLTDLEQQLRVGHELAVNSIKPFMEKWRESSIRTVLAEELHGLDIEPVFAILVSRRIIEKVKGVKDQEMIRRLKTAYWHDPSPTLRGVSNAITLAAHANPWPSPWVEDDLQSVASEIIGGRYQTIMQKATADAFDGGWRPGQFSLVEARSGIVAQQPIFQFE